MPEIIYKMKTCRIFGQNSKYFYKNIKNIKKLIKIWARERAPSCQETKKPPGTGGKKFLKFAKLTLIPIQKNLIDLDLVTDAELDWLDIYHKDVLEKVAPLLEEGSPAMKWLVKSCEKIERKR